jgi:hypothetical protein
MIERHDTQRNDNHHNDVKTNDTQHEGIICDAQHKGKNDNKHLKNALC